MIDLKLQFLENLKKEAEQAVFDGNLRKLTHAEKVRYASLHVDLRLVFDESRKVMLIEQSPVMFPLDIYLVCGERNQEEQEKAFNAGLSKVHYPNGKHNKNPSDAMDCAPVIAKPGQLVKPDWENERAFKYMIDVMMRTAKKLFEQGRISAPIRFGADFNRDGNLTNDKWVDMPHCERDLKA